MVCPDQGWLFAGFVIKTWGIQPTPLWISWVSRRRVRSRERPLAAASQELRRTERRKMIFRRFSDKTG